MLFNSVSFLFFLPISFILYWLVFGRRLIIQNIFLLGASYFFYAWWSWKFLLLLALCTLIDYLYGFGVSSSNRKKAKLFLWLSVINNLGLLATFKYYNFFAAEVRDAFSAINVEFNPIILQIALPVGISFYTFHGMSYIFDIYRGLRKPVLSFVDYAVFVSFFPLLVAGPIERANHLLPQIQSKRVFNYGQAVTGCRLILWGFFKKIVIADSLAVYVDAAFNDYQSYDALSLIICAIGFSFQIYCDFSGYCDIAIGTAKLLGFELFSNFKFPYFSRNIGEFWRRWHISLSSWFKDYVYIPLGGSKNGLLKTTRNIFIIFLLSGFWHGASWNFIIWGALHAIAFIPLYILNRTKKYSAHVVSVNNLLPTLKEIVQILSTFGFVTFAWIFFRMTSLESAIGFIGQILKSTYDNPKQYLQFPKFGATIILLIIPLIIIDWLNRRDERTLIVPENGVIRFSVYIGISFLIFTLFLKSSGTMIYFQF